MDEVKPKIPQRVADINAEIARQGNKGFSVAPSAPTYVPPTTISSSILQNDEKPLSIPTPTMGTSNADLNALLATSASQTKADALAEQTRLAQETAQTAADTSKSNLYDAFLKKIGVQQTKGAVQEQFGVAGKTQKVTDLTNQMEALDKAELDEIRNLGSQPGTLAQKAQREQDIRSNYNMRKADVAILQSAANRDLATASALAEAKINTQLEPLNTQIEFLSMFYEDNKEQLSKADQNAFNVAIQDAQAERTQKASELKILSDTKLEVLKNIYANASPEVANQLARSVQMATTPEQVMMAAGQFSGDVLERQKKQLEIQKLNKEIQSLGVPTITNPQAGKYAGALNILLGSGTFTKDQKATLINAVNNGQDPFSVIKNQAKNIMGQTNATKLDNYETAKQQLVDVQSALDQYYNLGGDTSLLKGNYEKVINKLGEVNDPDLVEIATQIQSALQIYRNAVSGTAYSVQEGADIASIFPGISKSKGLNKAVLNGRMAAFDSTIDATYKNVLGDTYSTLKQAEMAQKVQDVGIPKVIPQTQIPEGYYQASDGLFYKKQ